MLKLGFALTLLSLTAQARIYNYEDVPLGERSFGMGLTGMAATGDAANMYYNPAVLGLSDASQVSASLSAYARIDTRTGAYVSLFRSAADNVSRGGFLAIPSMVGGNIKSGEWIWGGTILIPNSFKNSGTVTISSTDVAAFESTFDSVWMGAFLARKFGRHSAGVSLFYASDEMNEKFFFIQKSTTPTTIRFVQNFFNVNGLALVVGGTYQVSDNLRIGYSFRPPVIKMGGTGEYADASSSAGVATAGKFDTRKLPIPMRLGLGVSWELPPKWTLTADLKVYGPMRFNLAGNNDPSFDVQAKETANVSVGAEYRGWEELGIRGGFFSNMSSAERVQNTLSAINDKVHMFGGTAALFFEKKSGSISLGGYVQGGQGSSMAVGSVNGDPVPRSNYIYGFVVGSSYKF